MGPSRQASAAFSAVLAHAPGNTGLRPALAKTAEETGGIRAAADAYMPCSDASRPIAQDVRTRIWATMRPVGESVVEADRRHLLKTGGSISPALTGMEDS